MELEERVGQIDFGVRVLGCVILLFATGLALVAVLSVGRIELIFSEMLGDKPLPALTQFVLDFRSILAVLVFSLFLGATSVGLGSRSPRTALIVIAAGVFVEIAAWLLISVALYLPMLTITTEMGRQ